MILVLAWGTSPPAHALEAVETPTGREASTLLSDLYQVPSAPWISLQTTGTTPGPAFVSAISPMQARGDAEEVSTLLAGARLGEEHEGRSTGGLLAQLAAGLVTVGLVARRRLTIR